MPTTTQQSVQLVPYDFERYVDNLISYLQHELPDTYQDFLEDNAARVLVDAVGWELSLLAYMINVNFKQWFLSTTSIRKAMFLLGKLVDYELGSPSASTVTLLFELEAAHTADITLARGHRVQTSDGVIFELTSAITMYAGDTEEEASATQGYTVIEIIGVSDGAKNQTYTSTQSGLKDSLVVTIDGVQWTNFENSLALTSSDKGYTSAYDEEYKLIITFGNGDFGMVPPTGAQIQMSYRHGGGLEGNVGTDAITELVDEASDAAGVIVTDLSVTNESPASGGADQETLDAARLNIPLSVRSMERLVSGEDFNSISSFFSSDTYGNVYKSAAVVDKYTWSEHIITIYILATDANGLPSAPGSGLISAVQDWVEDHKLPSVTASVEAGTLVSLNITAVVHYTRNQRSNIVQANVNLALQDMFDYDDRSIGEGVTLAEIYQTIMSADGVEWVDITVPAANVTVDSDEFLVEGTVTITYTEAS